MDYTKGLKVPRRYKLRLESELLERIKESARPRFRSINREIEIRLQRSFDRDRNRDDEAAA